MLYSKSALQLLVRLRRDHANTVLSISIAWQFATVKVALSTCEFADPQAHHMAALLLRHSLDTVARKFC